MNIDFNNLEKLIDIAERANIDSLEVVDGSKRITIVCQTPIAQNSNQNSNQGGLANGHQTAKDTVAYQENNANTSTVYADNSSDEQAQDSSLQDDGLVDSNSNANQITAPMLGTFYRRSDPSADVFVSVGDSVVAGDTLCVIEAMKIMHEVKADNAGIIEEILVEDGDVVEFDQALFTINLS